jgi:2Fe-2S ferredoxin
MADTTPDRAAPPPAVSLRIITHDPAAPAGSPALETSILARKGATILDAALAHGVNIDHACGGVCACATCHIFVLEGAQYLSRPAENESDQVELAPGLRQSSRLACQCVIEGAGPIVVEVPAWNRNAVREPPH